MLEEGKHPAQLRLIKEELLAYNLSMLKLRQSADKHNAVSLEVTPSLEQAFYRNYRSRPPMHSNVLLKNLGKICLKMCQ